MPRTDNEIRIIPSVLDRLVDGTPAPHHDKLRRFKQSVMHDFGQLSETATLPRSDLRQLRRSITRDLDQLISEAPVSRYDESLRQLRRSVMHDLDQLINEMQVTRDDLRQLKRSVMHPLDQLINETQVACDDLRQLEQSVVRDLEWLLNTRRMADSLPSELKATDRSLLSYGLPDFSHFSLNSDAGKEKLQRELEAAISLFEPRLDNVGVTLHKQQESKEQTQSKPVASFTVGFLITAYLKVEPAPESVEFDTVLDLRSGKYEVKKR